MRTEARCRSCGIQTKRDISTLAFVPHDASNRVGSCLAGEILGHAPLLKRNELASQYRQPGCLPGISETGGSARDSRVSLIRRQASCMSGPNMSSNLRHSAIYALRLYQTV